MKERKKTRHSGDISDMLKSEIENEKKKKKKKESCRASKIFEKLFFCKVHR